MHVKRAFNKQTLRLLWSIEFLGESELIYDGHWLSVGRSSCSRSCTRDERINCLLDTFSSVVVGCRYKSTERVIYTVIWDRRDAACMLRRQIDSRANKTRPKDRSCLDWWTQVLYFGFGLNVKIWRSKREWRDDSGDSLKVQQETKTRWWSSRSELCGQSKETRKALSHVTSHYTVNYILKTIYQH